MSNVAISSESIYNIRISYGVNAATMRTATCILVKGAGIYLIDPTLLSPQ